MSDALRKRGRARRRPPPVDWVAVRAAYEAETETIAAIAERFGTTPARIRGRREAEGWKVRAGGAAAFARLAESRHRCTPSEVKAMHQACIDGELSLVEICEKFGVTSYEFAALRRAGNWPRPPGSDFACGWATRPPTPRDMARRLMRTLETQLAALEARMSKNGNRPDVDDARLAGEIARGLERVAKLTGRQGREATADDQDTAGLDDETRDLEWRRQRLRQRIERLVGHPRSGGGDGAA